MEQGWDVDRDIWRKITLNPSESMGLPKRAQTLSVHKSHIWIWVAAEELERGCGVVLDMHWAGLQATW